MMISHNQFSISKLLVCAIIKLRLFCKMHGSFSDITNRILSLVLPVGVICRLCSLIVAFPGHFLYHFFDSCSVIEKKKKKKKATNKQQQQKTTTTTTNK